jgi:hypothetical protein
MIRYLPVLAAFAAIGAAGVVHGLWTDRWSNPAELALRLDQVSMSLGDWQGKPREFDSSVLGPIAGCLTRHYVNQRTGATVTVSLVCGRPGPVAIHTPDVCYVASGFAEENSTRFSPPLGSAFPTAEFKTSQFVRTRAADQTALRVIWSWNAGGVWTVSDTPRFAFAREPVLYKLHLVRELASANEPLDSDPCVEFLQLFLPELQKKLISPS